MIDLPDDMNAEIASSEYVWAECSDCGAALRKPVYDPDPVMCSHCADPYPLADRLDQDWLTDDEEWGPDSAQQALRER
jgi:hypothetical protein